MSDDHTRLTALVAEQIADYGRMSEQMDAQEEALAGGDVERLMEILQKKNGLVEAIGRRDDEMRGFAEAGAGVTEDVRDRLEELKKTAAALLEREEKSLVKLNALRSSVGREAMERAKARRAAKAYGADEPPMEPRFLDKNE